MGKARGSSPSNNNNNNNTVTYAAGTGWREEADDGELEQRSALIYLKKAIAALGFIVIAACVVLLWVFMGAEFGVPGLIIALAILLVITGAWRFIWIAIVTTPRDVK